MDKDIEFFSDLNRLLRENIKTIDEFKSENDIYDLNFLGRGDFGEAYSTGDGRVVKFTSSKSEFNIARQLEGNDSPVFNSFVKVFKTDLVDGKMTIIMEELELDSSIESLFLIAELESCFEVVIVTQNCDDLHERGGSSKVIHLHGDITVNRSTLKPKLKYPKTYKPILIGDKCEFGSQLRHDVVLFGEILDDRIISETIDHIKSSDVFLIIGTSLSVYPANSLINYVNDDCEVFLIDPNDIQINHNHITHIKDSAINGLTFLTKKLFKEYVE